VLVHGSCPELKFVSKLIILSYVRNVLNAKNILSAFTDDSCEEQLHLGRHIAGFQNYAQRALKRPEDLNSDDYLSNPLPYYEHTGDSIGGDLDMLKVRPILGFVGCKVEQTNMSTSITLKLLIACA
jgi:hypothetical protein